jgi:hypothetical protein
MPTHITPLQQAAQQAPAPIKVRQNNALPPAYAAAIGTGAPRPASGDWEEF